MSTLLRDDDFRDLPRDRRARFVHLEQIARARMNDVLQVTENERYTNFDVRREYAAITFGLLKSVPGVVAHLPSGNGSDYLNEFDDFVEFSISTSTELRMEVLDDEHSAEIPLRINARAKIENSIVALRISIEQSSLSDEKKKRLFAKLAEIENDIRSNPKINLQAAIAGLSLIAVGLGGFTSFLADAPQAAKTVSSMIETLAEEQEFNESLDMQIEQRETLLLSGPKTGVEGNPVVSTDKAARLGHRKPDENEIPF